MKSRETNFSSYFNLSLQQVYDNMRLKVNIVRAPDRPLSAYTPAIPFQVLKNYGFETMLLDVVEAPEPVLCYFSHHLGIHNVPIARNLRPDEVQRITTGLSQLQSFYTATMRVSCVRRCLIGCCFSSMPVHEVG